MRWFRLYTEIRDDPKMLQLSDWEFRQFIYLLCAAAESEKSGLIDVKMSALCRQNRSKMPSFCKILEKLQSLNVLSCNGNGIKMLNWEKRQYQSDRSAERTRKWREKQDNVTSQKRHMKRHGDGPETETETETETEKTPLIYITPPLGSFKNVKLKLEELEKLRTEFGEVGTDQRIESLSQYVASKGKKYKNHYATILMWERKNTGGKYGKSKDDKIDANIFLYPPPEGDE